MGIALTDEHRELGEIARAILHGRKARRAARGLLDAAEETRNQIAERILGVPRDPLVRRKPGRRHPARHRSGGTCRMPSACRSIRRTVGRE
ncbi:hypothetical protein [Nocardia brevicatena]|uniref:hypothetical protein n=1 Tax=Nocardia brevicatena TaxID=37327 RepID=UPI0002D878A5